MEKVDFRKTLKSLYIPSAKEVALVDVLPMNFLMIDGRGDPQTSKDYSDAVEALYSVSYAPKLGIKKGLNKTEYKIMPLESLWWTEAGEHFDAANRDLWQWTAMIMQPPLVTADSVEDAIPEEGEKKDLPALSKMRFENFRERRSARIMHVGSFSEEGPTTARVHKFVASEGYKTCGRHHEIYFNAYRRTAPGKLKTVIRQPLEILPK
jgi:hypothetical protein